MAISGGEVAKHATKSSCWIVLHNKVWDVTDYLSAHPGGEQLLARLAGQDATEDYDAMHNPELVASILPPSSCIGEFDTSTTHKLKQRPQNPEINHTSEPAKADHLSLSSIISVDDFEISAQKHLSPTGWAYYASGADDMYSIADCRRIFRLMKLRPRVLHDVSAVDTTVSILGHHSSLPVYISPTGLGKYAHPDAECALARAAGKDKIIQVVPTAPSKGHEEITAAGNAHGTTMMFQLYVNQDRTRAEATIRRAEELGYKAIWVTVDSPVLGKREMDNRLKAKEGTFNTSAGVAKSSSSGLLNPALVWEDLDWIRSITKLPLVLKGVQSVEDAVMAYKRGLNGVVLSHHGGRSIDTAQAPLVTLLEIRRYAPHLLTKKAPNYGQRKFEVYLDGGVRRGTDVVKALALGCTAVGIGRPFLYSMTGGYGEEGVGHLVSLLRSEIETNMALTGASKVKHLEPGMVNSKRVEMEVIDGGLVKL